MIVEICAIREKLFLRCIQNVLQKFWTQIFLDIIVTKCNQSVQVFSCMRNETGMKILAHGMHSRHYGCTCSHYTGTTQSTGTIQVSEQLLAIWKRDAYLRSCTYAQRRIHFLMPEQKELIEQGSSH